MTEENPPTAAIQKTIDEIENVKSIDKEFKKLFMSCREFEQRNFIDSTKFFLDYGECSYKFDKYIEDKLVKLRKKLCELRGE